MKNSTLIIFIILYQILFLSKGISNEIEFSASDIEIKNNQNLTIANNATANFLAKLMLNLVLVEIFS